MGKHMFYVTHTSLLSILLLKFSSFYAFILLVFVFSCFFETVSYCVAQAETELMIPPFSAWDAGITGVQTMPDLFYFFF